MEKIRSERHNKISGDFGEHFVCYWLSLRNINNNSFVRISTQILKLEIMLE